MAKLLDMSRRVHALARPDLIVWPEAAIPGVFQTRPAWQAAIARFTSERHTPVLAGALYVDHRPDGTYELRVIDGTYSVEASAPNYVSESATVSVGRSRTVTLDFSLRAARAEVAPSAISATVEAGETTEETVTITNTGSAPLTFEVRERDFGGIPPELPPVETSQRIVRRPEWARARLPADLRTAAAGAATCTPDLDVIIDDPANDALGAVDITTVRGGADDAVMSMALDFTAGTPMGEVVGLVHLDTDQDPTTGLPPDALFGLPTQDIGVDFFADLFELPFEPIVLIWSVETFELEAIVPAAIEGQSVCFDVPLDVFAPDHDGSMDVTMVVGDFFEPTDWAPDVGHGTIEPFRDAPWMAADPDAGTLEPGNIYLGLQTPELQTFELCPLGCRKCPRRRLAAPLVPRRGPRCGNPGSAGKKLVYLVWRHLLVRDQPVNQDHLRRDNIVGINLTSALVIDGAEVEKNFGLAARNLPEIDVLPVAGINVYDIMRRNKLVLTKAALEALEARLK